NPLAMAVGNAVLDIILEPGFLKEVERKGLLLKQRLAELKDRHPGVIADVRGHGLMMGLRSAVPNTEFIAAARAQKLLVIGAGDNVARLLPPLIISDAEIGEAVNRIEAACAAIEAGQQNAAQRGVVQ
ncbi:aminotransferase class III-fold pyridoxal phosphate-dependent enzyme, partial [Microvirga arabica]